MLSMTIQIPIGVDYLINFRWTSKYIVGQPILLHGYTFACTFVYDSDINKILYTTSGDNNITLEPCNGIVHIIMPKDVTSTLSCYDSGLYTIGYLYNDNYNEVVSGRWNAITQLYNRDSASSDNNGDNICRRCTIDWGY